MFGKHIFLYLLGLGIPSIINFLSIIIYTRLLLPEEYGIYALILVIIRMFGIILFQWLRNSLFRYFPSYKEDNRKYLLSTAFMIFLCMTILTVFLYFICISLFFDNDLSTEIIILGLFVIISQEWFETNLGIMRYKLLPKKYGIANFAKSLITLAVGVPLVLTGTGATGIIIGVLLGTAIPSLYLSFREWKGIHVKFVKWNLVKQFLIYGLPLSASFAMGFIIYGTDRLLIQYFSGEANVGIYSVSYDLVNQSMFVLLNIINVATYPIILHKYENNGLQESRLQIQHTFVLLLFIGIGSALGLSLLSSNISAVLLGKEYREMAELLIPIVAPAVLLNVLKQYYFDIPFKLKKKSFNQVIPVFIGGFLNFGLNLWWIPKWGTIGAAYASLIAYCITVIITIIYANRLVKFPIPILEMGKIGIAALAMWGSLIPISPLKGISALLLQIGTGLTCYVLCALLLNIAGVKDSLRKFLKQMGKNKSLPLFSKNS